MCARRTPGRIALVIWGGWTVAAFGQGNLGFLGDTPIGHFSNDDWQLLRKAVTEVLNDSSATATQSWKNDVSGHSGEVRTLKVYRSDDGRDCKLLRVDNLASGYSGSTQYNVCRDEKGSWRDAGRPPPAGRNETPLPQRSV